MTQSIHRSSFITQCIIVTFAFWLTSIASVFAHSFNESYVYFDVTEDTLSGRVEVTLADLTRISAQSDKVETKLTKEQATAMKEEFFSYFAERIVLMSNGERLPVTFDGIAFLDTEVDSFAQLAFDVGNITTTPVSLDMAYNGVFGDIDPTHRGYALIGSNTRNGMDENEGYISLIFSPGEGSKKLYLNDEPTFNVAMTFLEHGVWHIWLGFDHVLFLITLLLSAVMIVKAQQWVPEETLKDSLKKTIIIVTVFTLAHTITLTLATFNIIVLPVLFVEAVIAASIAVVAIGNLFPRLHIKSWLIVFIFGLFHGFGFANVLEPLGLDPARKALGLVAFNIGVELGQLAIVLVVFPILFLVRKHPAYRPIALQLGSIALIAIALFWFWERTSSMFETTSLLQAVSAFA